MPANNSDHTLFQLLTNIETFKKQSTRRIYAWAVFMLGLYLYLNSILHYLTNVYDTYKTKIWPSSTTNELRCWRHSLMRSQVSISNGRKTCKYHALDTLTLRLLHCR
jgi:hypothetical protein